MCSIVESWMEMEERFEEELQNALRLLKLNRENVPEEILRTRYRKKYARLKEDIGKLTEEYIKIHITCGLFFEEKDRKPVTDAINSVIADSGIAKAAGAAAFQRQDMEEIRMLAEELKNQVWKQTADWRIEDAKAGKRAA